MKIPELYQQLKPHIARDFKASITQITNNYGGGSGGGGGSSVAAHYLTDSAMHLVSGLTAGHVLQALTSTSFGFAALGSTSIIAGLGYTPVNRAGDTMTGNLAMSTQPTAGNQVITQQYLLSRLQNLVTNGDGSLLTNYNFSTWATFDATEIYSGAGAFKYTGSYIARYGDEYIAVDPSKYYRLAATIKCGNADGSGYDSNNKQYFGLACFDIDRNAIGAQYFMQYSGTAKTTLAAQLNPGDTTVTLTSASGWNNGANFYYSRQFLWWPYANSYGYEYPAYTYSRNTTFNYAGYNTNGAWAAGGISGNTITLTAAWPGPTLPAGTPVMNGTSGNAFKYVVLLQTNVLDTWTRYEGYIGNIDTDGTNGANEFPPGTAQVKLYWGLNYTGTLSSNVIRYNNIWFSEMSARNIEVASATSPGVIALANQQLGTGDKWLPGKLGIGTSSAPTTYALEVTGQAQIKPASALPPLVLNANAQGQTVVGFKADQLNRQIINGGGLSINGGASAYLTGDVTITFGTPSTTSTTSTNTATGTTHSHAADWSSAPGAASKLLGTASDGSLTLGSNNAFKLDNTLAAIGFGVVPDGAASYDFKALSAADHTVRIKQLLTQTGRLWRVEDTSGNELIVLDSQGNLQSGQPGFVSGLTGWQITPIGNAEFNNAFIRGELHASIFVMDEFHASSGTLWIANAGKLENQWTVNLTTGNELVLDLRTTSASGSGLQLDLRTTSASGSGSQLTTRNITNYIDITDPPSGHAMLFAAGQTLRLKSLGNISPGIDLYDIWCKVLYVEDQTSFYRYYVQIWSGGTHGAVIPAGTADVSYGKKGDGRILLTSDQNYAPYMDVFTVGEQPWTGDITPHVRIGRLDGVGVPGVSGIEQYGLVAGTNLANANSPYFVLSNLKQYMYRIGSEWNNGINPTVTIDPSGRFKIGLDTTNANLTAFDFDPALGTLSIGSAAYPVAVNLVGNMTIQNPGSIATSTLNNDAGWTLGAAWGTNLTGRPTELTDGRITAGFDSSGNLITKVLPGSNVGTPGGAGLFLGADKMGYYSGGAWTLYMDNTGKMGLGGTSGARLAWDGTDLYGTDGSTVQWYARASTGKLYAGAGAQTLDANGLTLINDTSNSYAAQLEKNAVTFNRSGIGTIGRLTSYYISGTTTYGVDAYAMSPNSEAVLYRARAIAQANVYGGTAPGIPTMLLQSGASDYAKIFAAIIQFFATSNTTPSIEAIANQVRIYDDLRLDGTTNHALGIRTTA